MIEFVIRYLDAGSAHECIYIEKNILAALGSFIEDNPEIPMMNIASITC